MKHTDKTILVTGATGQQGGATAAHLLAAGWQVRALVRDASTGAAAALARAGAALAVCDMDDRASLDAAMRGAHGVFSVQTSNADEVRQGTNVIDAARAGGVRHVVYSSVGGAEGLARYHPLAKWEIEQHLRSVDMPATILRPAGFMEDFAGGRFMNGGELTVPFHPGVAVQLVAVDDIGAVAAAVFAQPEATVGQVLDVAGDALTAPRIAEALSHAAGRAIPYVQVPLDVVRQASPAAATVYEWANTEYYTPDTDAARGIHPGLMDFPTWLDRTGKRRLAVALDHSTPAD